MANNRVINAIKLNTDTNELVIKFRGSSSAIEAKALDFKVGVDGDIEYLLLDRLIHNPHEQIFDCFMNDEWKTGFSISGCIVSELRR